MRPLSEQVVVVTGASSGIGRETALLLASRGASVVVAARNEAALRDLEAGIVATGGSAFAVVADVASWADVQRIGDEAMARFGRIDTWVNNAGVTVYARLVDTAPDELERVIRVNLLGVMHGTKVALERMRGQETGAVINVASVLGQSAVPLQAAYVASKHGVKGFTDAVRQEVMSEGWPISITTVYPSSIGTPLFRHARSKLGVQPKPVEPVYDPRLAAEAIAAAAERPIRDVSIGSPSPVLAWANRIAPSLLDRFTAFGRLGERMQQTDLPDDGIDNVDEPMREPGAVRGSFDTRVRKNSFSEQLGLSPVGRVLGPAMLGGVALVSALALRSAAGRGRR